MTTDVARSAVCVAVLAVAGMARAASPLPDQGGFDPLVAQAHLLRDALGTYRALATAPDWAPDIPAIDGVIRQGDRHAALAAVRERLVRLGDLPAGPGGDPTFDASLDAAVRRFQRRHGLADDGIIGPATDAALRRSPAERVAQIEAALARLAALPEQRADRTIVVNIPMFHLWAWEAASPDRPALASRVIVGRPTTPTPAFDAVMREVVFRPPWNVPLSIARNEIVPRLRREPAYLDRQRIEVVTADGVVTRPPLSEATLAAIAAGSLRLRQRPGPDNALGLVKFVQPNPHSVYLHDTPNHRLFDGPERALSHGCVRVDEAAALAEWLLADPVAWARPQVDAHLHGEQTVTVPVVPPVLTRLVYLRAMVWPDGAVHFAPDLYRRDTGPAERLSSECAG